MTMQDNLHIFGAGLSGLIAARMLQDRNPIVYERQGEVPNNHKALLRFRDDGISRALNIPFRKVRVIKDVLGSKGSVSDMLNYSLKVTGQLRSRSILDLDPVDRFIAPPDLVARLAATTNLRLGVDFLEWSSNLIKPHGPIISTIPMPIMMELFNWKDRPDFQYSGGWTLRGWIDPTLKSRVNCTVYSPDPDVPFYRASITDDIAMFEGVCDGYKDRAMSQEAACSLANLWADMAFGLSGKVMMAGNLSSSHYQKIVELEGKDRESAKRFIMYLSSEHNIYSLGRYATWRPKLLLDDLVKDINVIRSLMDGESLYPSQL